MPSKERGEVCYRLPDGTFSDVDLHAAILGEDLTPPGRGGVVKGYPEFDPGQDRDDSGKWTSGGGDSGGDAPPSLRDDQPATAPATVKSLSSAGIALSGDKDRALDMWNKYVAPKVSPQQFKRQMLGGFRGTVEVNALPGDTVERVIVNGDLETARGEDMGSWGTMLDFARDKVYLSLLDIKKRHGGRGAGKQFMREHVALYKDLGFEAVELNANIDIGGYAWAKYGFVPTERSWSRLRDRLDSNLMGIIEELEEGQEGDDLLDLLVSDDPQALWPISDSKHGKDLLIGEDWDGALDFDDKEAMERFNAYVGVR